MSITTFFEPKLTALAVEVAALVRMPDIRTIKVKMKFEEVVWTFRHVALGTVVVV